MSVRDVRSQMKAAEDCRSPKPGGGSTRLENAKRLGLRQSSAAFAGNLVADTLNCTRIRASWGWLSGSNQAIKAAFDAGLGVRDECEVIR